MLKSLPLPNRLFDLDRLLMQRGRNLAPAYRVFGSAQRGGIYNSHVMGAALLPVLAALGVMPWPLAAWLLACVAVAITIDSAPWRRKLRVTAMPGQLALYLQVLAQAVWDALPMYALAFALYVGLSPIWSHAHLGINTFYVLYGIYLAVRTAWLARCLWIVAFHWDGPRPAPLNGDEANLRSRRVATEHLLWAYFLGNVGVAVRCAAFVISVALWRSLQTGLGLDLTQHAALAPYLIWICIACSIIWILTLGPAIRRAQLVFYRTHRTLHDVKPLYDSIHWVHHKGVLPSPLDSGTISPAEFAITEYAIPTLTLTPDWYWIFVQVLVAALGHWPGHFFGASSETAQHHVEHHRRFTTNFGLMPVDDDYFGTRSLPPAAEEQAPAAPPAEVA